MADSPRHPIPPSEWTDPRHRYGFRGELAAIRYFVAEGWRIEAHRFRYGRHDLDLVVRKGPLVAFVEVKARRAATHGRPGESVGWRKRQTLALGAAWWRQRFGRAGDRYRFDLVAVTGRPGAERVAEHVPDAWRTDGF